MELGTFMQSLRVNLAEGLSEEGHEEPEAVLNVFDKAAAQTAYGVIDGAEAPAPKPAKKKTRKPRAPKTGNQGDGNGGAEGV